MIVPRKFVVEHNTRTEKFHCHEYYFQITFTIEMLEEANDETLALIKKLGSLLYQDEHFEEFKTILGSISPKVVRCSAMVHVIF